MKTRYIDLIDQTFDFPQPGLRLDGDNLMFHGIDLMSLVEEYGTPLKFFYLPQIGTNIQKVRGWMGEAMSNLGYTGSYFYCYCTKSSHFRFVVEEALKNGAHIETSSAFDIDLILSLHAEGSLSKDHYIICNGFKTKPYLEGIAKLHELGFKNVVCIIDNEPEFQSLLDHIEGEFQVGIRIAAEEEPKFNFYTSRLGIRYSQILPLYLREIKNHPRVKLRMLHFFINTGINDSAYYWNELHKCLNVYTQLKDYCEELDYLNIGGGFPIQNSLYFEFDYAYILAEILDQVMTRCREKDIREPHIFTEFGSFTVGESGGMIFKILGQKQQNDREKWNMIDGSFMTHLPDSWAINKRFLMLPVNRWNEPYERVLLGGLTCDSDDFYNAEQHVNAIYLPKYDPSTPQYIGFFNTGAYQETVGGYGGIQHCLIPQPPLVMVDHEEGEIRTRVFRPRQQAGNMLEVLGYPTDNS